VLDVHHSCMLGMLYNLAAKSAAKTTSPIALVNAVCAALL
jgi:hypothetical protein